MSDRYIYYFLYLLSLLSYINNNTTSAHIYSYTKKYKISTITMHNPLHLPPINQMLLLLLLNPLLINLNNPTNLLILPLIMRISINFIFKCSYFSLLSFPIFYFLFHIIIAKFIIIFRVFPQIVFSQSIDDVLIEILLYCGTIDCKDCCVLICDDILTSFVDIVDYVGYPY